MTDIWNAKTYSQFLDLRTRPAKDLLAGIPNSFKPRRVYDLGCGPGNSTILLKEHWPNATVIGVDSSSDMLEEAKKSYPELSFTKGDIAEFSPIEKIDCLFANASLQWLGHHETLLPALLKLIKTGGILAIQMSNNFHCPSHQVTIDILQNDENWRPLLTKLRYAKLNEPFYKLSWYYDLLGQCEVSSIQCWETEYFHEMSDYQEIFDWVKGTGLRPILSAMDKKDQSNFSAIYLDAISKAYPLQKNKKILFPFRRIFIVAVKGYK